MMGKNYIVESPEIDMHSLYKELHDAETKRQIDVCRSKDDEIEIKIYGRISYQQATSLNARLEIKYGQRPRYIQSNYIILMSSSYDHYVEWIREQILRGNI